MINSESILDYKNDVASLTDVGKVRETNEDNLGFAQTPNGDVFVVCDGMGGHVGGQVASTIAVESVIEYFSSEEKPNIFIAINEAINFANRRIIEKWAEQPELKGMGTTLVLIVIQNGELYLGHVGDSRAYLFTDKKLHRITKDHSYVQGLVDSGIITDDEAEQHPRKSELTRALGIRQDVEPTIVNRPLQLKNEDMILMCSDGLSGLVNDPTIEQALAKNEAVSKTGKDLIDMALNAGGHDNITLHLFRVTNSKFSSTIFEKVQVERKSIESTLTNIPEVEDKSGFNLQDLLTKRVLILSIVLGVVLLGFAYWMFSVPSIVENDNGANNIDTTINQVDNGKIDSDEVDKVESEQKAAAKKKLDDAAAKKNADEEAIDKKKSENNS